MKLKKYHLLNLQADILRTPRGDFFVDVLYATKDEERITQTFYINDQCFLTGDGGKDHKPKYLTTAVMILLRIAFEGAHFRIFEYDHIFAQKRYSERKCDWNDELMKYLYDLPS